MRWKGLIPLVVIIAVFVVIGVFFIDKWIESGLEKTGASIVGARVEIDHLKFSLFSLSFKWDRLQVTDPKNTMTNIIETGRTAFKMNAPALFRKRYVIEEMTLADVRHGTARKYDGALPKKVKPPKKKSDKPGPFDKIKAQLNSEMAQMPVMNFDLDQIKRKLNLDSLIVMADLKIVGRVDSVRTDIDSTAEKWQTFYKTFRPDEDLKKIKTDLTEIDPKQIKTLPELLSTVEKAKSAEKQLKQMYEDVNNRKKEIVTDFDRLATYGKSVDNWLEEDYKRILQKAQLPDLSVKNIGKILFGSTIVNQINQYLDYLELIRANIPKKSEKPEKETRPRMVGQNILFPDRHGWPSFLIKKIHLSGQTGATDEAPGLQMAGNVTGITSQPWIYGQPTQVKLDWLQANKPSGFFAAVFNHVTEISNDSFQIALDNVSLNNVAIHKSQYLPSKIAQGRAAFLTTVRLKEDNFLAQFNVKARDLNFDFGQLQTQNKFVEITREVIGSLDLLTLDAQVAGAGDEVDFRLNSNLDDLVSSKLKSMGSAALKDAENKIRNRLNSIKAEQLAKADKLYNEKRQMIEGKIENYRSQVEAEKTRIENKLKDLEDEVKRRKKEEEDKVKGKAKDALDNLLKKRP